MLVTGCQSVTKFQRWGFPKVFREHLLGTQGRTRVPHVLCSFCPISSGLSPPLAFGSVTPAKNKSRQKNSQSLKDTEGRGMVGDDSGDDDLNVHQHQTEFWRRQPQASSRGGQTLL